MKQKLIFRPGVGGYVSDITETALKAEAATYLSDGTIKTGVLRQRLGWAYEAAQYPSTWTGLDYPNAVWRSQFLQGTPLAHTATLVSTDINKFARLGYGAAGTVVADVSLSTGDDPLPRCVYRGELIYCYSDGKTPVRRYGGCQSSSINQATAASLTRSTNVGTGTLTAGTLTNGNQNTGAYFPLQIGQAVWVTPRLTYATSTTTVSYQDAQNTQLTANGVMATGTIVASHTTDWGWPCIEIYSQGSAAVTRTPFTWSSTEQAATYTASGTGTSWTIGLDVGDLVRRKRLALLYKDTATNWKLRSISTIDSATSMTLAYDGVWGGASVAPAFSGADQTYTQATTGGTAGAPATTTAATYAILSPPTFTDCTVHKGSLFGTGVYWNPTRVYIAPPGWDMSYPPSATLPYDISTPQSNAEPSIWKLDYIDVPATNDPDRCVAVLSTPGPLLVLKQDSVYGISGVYPTFEQSLITKGAGCIDRRSAVSVDGVAFWAGKDGVYAYRDGRVVSLSRNKIDTEWRSLMRGWQASTSGCSIGVVDAQVVVSVWGLSSNGTIGAKVGPDSSGPTRRVLIYDLNAGEWVGRFTYARASGMGQLHSCRVPGEVQGLLAVDPANVTYSTTSSPNNVIDLAPSFTGVRVTNRSTQATTLAGSRDPDNLGPYLTLWTPTNLGEHAGVDGEGRLIDVSVVTKFKYSTTPSTTTTIAVAAFESGGLRSDEAPVEVSIGNITSTSEVDGTTRNRFFAGRSGRNHQLRLAVTGNDTNSTVIEVQQISATFRDARSRS